MDTSQSSLPGVQWPGHGVEHPPKFKAEFKETVELYLYCSCCRTNCTFYTVAVVLCREWLRFLVMPELCAFGVSFESHDFYSETAWFESWSGHRLLELSYSLLPSPLLRKYSVILPQITSRSLSSLHAYWKPKEVLCTDVCACHYQQQN
jgi:hypothetical protein